MLRVASRLLWASLFATLGLMGLARARLLSPHQAFGFTAVLAPHHRIDVRWRVAPGYHLYSRHVHVTLGPAPVVLGAYQLPPGQPLVLPGLGSMPVYFQSVGLSLPYHLRGAAPQTLVVTSRYQGCANTGVCYPPITTTVALPRRAAPHTRMAAPTLAPSLPLAAGPISALRAAKPGSHHGFYSTVLRGNIWLTLGLFFVLGIGLTFTPCVFPMIPILSALIVGQGDDSNNASQARGRAFRLSLAYIGGMALTYTAAGILAALSGAYLAAFFQNAWVLGVFSGVFVLLSLSMFGFYDIQFPAVIRDRFLAVGRGGHLIGSFVMGALAVLIVSPCIAAPLAGALLYISQTGNLVLGGGALLALSLGMGLPLLIIGTSAGHFLPRAGRWMDTVKAIFGVLLLGVAILLVSRIIPAPATLALWALLALVVAVYVGAFDAVTPGVSGWRRLRKGVGLALFAYGLALGSGALRGGNSVLAPWPSQPPSVSPSGHPSGSVFRTVTTWRQFQAALTAAHGRSVVVDFWATWCLDCKAMNTVTFANPRVQKRLATMALIRVDVTKNDAQAHALLHKLGVFGPPAILLFNAAGQEVGHYPGYEGPATLRRRLERLGGAP